MACAFASAALTLRAEGPAGAIAVRTDLPAGHTLTAADLLPVKGTVDASVIDASHTDSVIGRRLTVPLVAGALLTERNIGEPSYPPPGQAVIGVAVKAGQYPPDLSPGDQVAVVAVPGDVTVLGAKTNLPEVGAVVTGVQNSEQSQNPTVVTLVLTRSDAETIATPAAQGLVALMQVSSDRP
ncbi:SAF domain-containing protein [Streptosporangium algeriense]|uniref:SAF domain-containing protein n=1 Tax=Streptosporangium algeriense TaxID=1682748 RepID=A0ABW3DJ05_9ACTN